MIRDLVFQTNDNDTVFLLDDSLLVKFKDYHKIITNSHLNAVFLENVKYVFNHCLSQENIDRLETESIEEYLINKSKSLNLDPSRTSGLITKAKMENYGISHKTYRNLELTAISTAGVKVNAARAGDPAQYYEENNNFDLNIGTINTILIINGNLSNDALVSSLITAVEAKTVALNNLRVPSLYSNGFATGTGTDEIIIASNQESDNHLSNGGKHSKLGELVALSVIESIYIALDKEMSLNPKSQANALVRLNRFKLDINEFYKDMNHLEKEKFIKDLVIHCKKPLNIAITSSILNLIDEVSNNLISKDVANDLANKIIDNCEDYTIFELLNFWIYIYLQ